MFHCRHFQLQSFLGGPYRAREWRSLRVLFYLSQTPAQPIGADGACTSGGHTETPPGPPDGPAGSIRREQDGLTDEATTEPH